MTEQKPPKPGKAAKVFSWIFLAMNVVVCGCLAALILTTLGSYRRLFARMTVELPALTRLLLSAGEPVLVTILGLVVVAAVVKEIVLPWVRVRLWTNVAIALVGLAFYCAYHFALVLPMHKLVGRVGR